MPGFGGGGAMRALLATAAWSTRQSGVAHAVLPLVAPTPGTRERLAAHGLELHEPGDPGAMRAVVAAADVVQVHFWNTPELYAWFDADWPPHRLLLWVHVGGARPPQVLPPEVVRAADVVVATSPYV